MTPSFSSALSPRGVEFKTTLLKCLLKRSPEGVASVLLTLFLERGVYNTEGTPVEKAFEKDLCEIPRSESQPRRWVRKYR